MNKCVSLPGIQNVWYIQRDYLPDDVVYRAVAGIPISLEASPISITVKGEAVCEVEQSFDNNSYIEKAKLTFLTLDEVPTVQHPAFVIRTIDDSYLSHWSQGAAIPHRQNHQLYRSARWRPFRQKVRGFLQCEESPGTL